MDLAGSLHLHWHEGRPVLRSSRREWAAVVSLGRPAEALPALLGSVYALCGGAHRVAATLAVRAAQGQPTEPTAQERATVHQDTMQEHVRRLWLEGPALVPAHERPTGHALHALPRTTEGAGQLAWPAWIAREVLGQHADTWGAAWWADPQAWAAQWATAGATWPARWLAAGMQHLGVLSAPVRALPVPATAELAGQLADAILSREGFALQPQWQGRCAETGAWTRAQPLAAAQAFEPLWMRLAARVAELARLACCEHTEPNALALGAQPLPEQQGLAWVETARGLLVHWVQLGTDGRVQRCHVVAPTEWNFHPEGAAVSAWSALAAHGSEAAMRWVAAAYDPCVALSLDQPRAEAAHA